MSSQHRYYPALDGARAIAALLVLLFHAAQEGLPLPSVVNFGQTGVDLFFVLSGFLITSILLAARQGDWSEVRTFYARRALRIFPLYYLSLGVCALFFFPCGWPYWVYLQNFWTSTGKTVAGPVHLWSLAVEEQFYLVWPFLVLFVPRRLLLRILGAVIVISFGLRVAIASAHHDVYSLTFTRLDGLSAGSVLATLHHRGQLQRWRSLLLALVLVSGTLIMFTGWEFRGSGNPWFVAAKYSLLAALYAGVIGWLVCSPRAFVSRLLSTRPLRQIGRVSYGLYVWHPFVFSLTYRWLRGYSPLTKGFSGFVLAFATAYLSWYGFERHFLKLKGRLVPEPRFSPQAPVSG